MRKARQLYNNIVADSESKSEKLVDSISELFFYAPKRDNNILQNELISKSEQFDYDLFDPYLNKNQVSSKYYKWGTGEKKKILLSHGWGTKGIDFIELINNLISNDDYIVVSFDAPGHGTSIADYSHLLLFVDAIERVWEENNGFDYLIGHSIGAMANQCFLNKSNNVVEKIINITPLTSLTDYYNYMLLGLSSKDIVFEEFSLKFQSIFNEKIEEYNLIDLMSTENKNQFFIHDENDKLSKKTDLDVLSRNNSYKFYTFNDFRHYNMHKKPEVITLINSILGV